MAKSPLFLALFGCELGQKSKNSKSAKKACFDKKMQKSENFEKSEKFKKIWKNEKMKKKMKKYWKNQKKKKNILKKNNIKKIKKYWKTHQQKNKKKYFHKKMISTVHSVAEAGLKRSPFS